MGACVICGSRKSPTLISLTHEHLCATHFKLYATSQLHVFKTKEKVSFIVSSGSQKYKVSGFRKANCKNPRLVEILDEENTMEMNEGSQEIITRCNLKLVELLEKNKEEFKNGKVSNQNLEAKVRKLGEENTKLKIEICTLREENECKNSQVQTLYSMKKTSC